MKRGAETTKDQPLSFKMTSHKIEVTQVRRTNKYGIRIGLRVTETFQLPDGQYAISVWSTILKEKLS